MVKGKILKLSTPEGQYNVRVTRSSYVNNGSLAVCLYYEDDGEWLPFCAITVNVDDGGSRECFDEEVLPWYECQYVDVNNCYWAIRFLEENKIAYFAGGFADSGYCSYPLYAFDLDKLAELERG